MLKRIVMSLVVVSFASSLFAAKKTEGFEDKSVLKKWEIEGDAVINSTQKHSGKNALSVPAGATATLRFGTDDKFGSVSMWVYDSCVNTKDQPGKNWNGPYFGLINSDDDKAVEFVCWRPYLSAGAYSDVFTSENQWSNVWYSQIARKAAGWNKFTFTFTDEATLGVTFNDEKEDNVFPKKLEFFKRGANGLILGGGQDLGDRNESFYYDDIEIDMKDAPRK